MKDSMVGRTVGGSDSREGKMRTLMLEERRLAETPYAS